jgi:hypothetical protein
MPPTGIVEEILRNMFLGKPAGNTDRPHPTRRG